MPTAPVEIADAVEEYAREWGRHATLHCVPILLVHGRVERVAWLARLSLRPNDKRLLLYQQGKAPEPPTENVWFVEPNPKAGQPIPGAPGIREPDVVGLKIEEMGVGGIRRYLQRGNTWSGRGEFKSIEDQAKQAMEYNAAEKERHRQRQKEASRKEQLDKRRSRFKIPFLPIGIDLGRKSAAQGEDHG